jgi:hypothetical protein
MTYFSVGAGERATTVRYMPVFVWLFVVLVAYGISQLIGRMATGLTPFGPGPLMALGLLLAMALFTLYVGGQLVVVTFDRPADLVCIRRYGVTGRQVEERRLSDVVSLDVRILRRAQHRLELRLRSGERLPLTPYYVVTLNNGAVTHLSERIGLPATVIQPERA